MEQPTAEAAGIHQAELDPPQRAGRFFLRNLFAEFLSINRWMDVVR